MKLEEHLEKVARETSYMYTPVAYSGRRISRAKAEELLGKEKFLECLERCKTEETFSVLAKPKYNGTVRFFSPLFR